MCVFFLLAVHRLVLIVKLSGSSGAEEEDDCSHVLLLKQCFCSGLMNPSVLVSLFFWSFFLFVCLIDFSLSWTSSKGVGCFCKVEGQEKRTMTTRKITFPLEEKKIKKSMAVYVCFSVFWNLKSASSIALPTRRFASLLGNPPPRTGNVAGNILWQQFATLTSTAFLSAASNQKLYWANFF